MSSMGQLPFLFGSFCLLQLHLQIHAHSEAAQKAPNPGAFGFTASTVMTPNALRDPMDVIGFPFTKTAPEAVG